MTHVGPAISLESIHAGAPVRVGGQGGPSLPIDTDGTVPGAVLVAGPDGVYRPAPAPPAETRGSVIHYLDAFPEGVPLGVLAGDWVTVIAGEHAGIVYHVEES